MIVEQLFVPNNLADAYVTYTKYQDAVLMAGGVFLRLQKKSVERVIDLSKLDLDYVRKEEDLIRIGAMTNLGVIEQDSDLPLALRASVRQVGGVALRNVATVGGSVCGKYPFSDITTALLALNTSLFFYKGGEIPIESYLKGDYTERDILKEVIVRPKKCSQFKCFKSVYTDFSLVNIAVSYDTEWSIAVGSRPGGPLLLKEKDITNNRILELLNTIDFGGDNRASGKYRKILAEALIQDAIEEVSKWK